MLTPQHRDRMIDEWLREIDDELARRAELKEREAGVAIEEICETLIEMGERISAGSPEMIELIDELIETGGDRKRIDAIRHRVDMSQAGVVASILTRDPPMAARLLEEYAREATRSARAKDGANGRF